VIAGRLYRLGQDNRGAYGDGITVCEIVRLDTDHYEERPTARLRVPGRRGPHTLDRWNATAIVDLYADRRDASAGLRRLRTRLRPRSQNRDPRYASCEGEVDGGRRNCCIRRDDALSETRL
jgi:hypothetical protein